MGLRKIFIGGFFMLGVLVAGFIFLIRACLSQYDERSAITPALFIEKDGKAVLFSLVKYSEATSYSQKGGFTSKSVSTSYYIQTNNPETGAQLAEQKIKHHSDIKHYPIETLGSSAGLAWLFIGEIMAFDPFSFEKKADKNMIESKNPSLKGKLPDDRRFYRFNYSDSSISITANDGTFWKLNPASLVATAQDKEESEDPLDAALAYSEKLREQNRKLQETLLYKERDSLRQVEAVLRKKEAASRQLYTIMNSLRQGRKSYQQIKTNQDTAGGQWLGIYSTTERDKLRDDVYMHTAYEETARRQLYGSVYTEQANGDSRIDMEQIKILSANNFFLQGGFLLDKQTGLAARVGNSGARLIVHKDKIGNEGKILLTRVDQSGKILWTMETGLKEWLDWVISRDRIFIFGADNPDLSGDECNVLWSVDLTSGKATRYDYFTDK
jgi:hypothetical protein